MRQSAPFFDMVGKFTEGLFEDLRAGISLLDEAGLPDLFCNWCDPGICLEFARGKKETDRVVCVRYRTCPLSLPRTGKETTLRECD